MRILEIRYVAAPIMAVLLLTALTPPAGGWSGTITQSNNGAKLTATVHFTPFSQWQSSHAASIAYNPPGCTGYWDLFRTENNYYIFLEVITKGTCVTPDCIKIAPNAKENRLSFEASNCNGFTNPTNTGTLSPMRQ
jgi:hypothetical protein